MRRFVPLASLVFLIAFAFAQPVGLAQEAPAPAEPVDLPKLVQQLDSDKFNERQAATQKLTEIGRDAIPALVEAAKNPSREASSRSLEILRKHLQSKDEALQKAARESLEALAKSDVPRIATGAAEALKPKPDPNQPQPFGVPGLQGRAPIQLQVQAMAVGGGRRVAIQNVNGVKTTTVEENGRKVKIVEDPAKGIEMEVTEKVDGKDQTKKYEAKDVAELKTKHPEAHKIYEQSAKQPNVQIQFGAVPIAPGIEGIQAIPALPRALPPFRNGLPGLPGMIDPQRQNAIREQLDKVQRDLKEAEERIKKNAGEGAQAEEIAKSLQQIEAARKQLEEAAEKLKTP